jgi:hypothetical protein
VVEFGGISPPVTRCNGSSASGRGTTRGPVDHPRIRRRPPRLSAVIVPAGEGCAVDRINGERATLTIGRAATRCTYALRENTELRRRSGLDPEA